MSLIDRLERAGFREVHGHAPYVFVRLVRRGNWMTGTALVLGRGVRLKFEAAVDMNEAAMEAIAYAAPQIEALGQSLMDEEDVGHDDEIGRRRRRRRRRKRKDKRFKKWLAKFAERIAKNRVMKRLRRGYAKALDSPYAELGVNALSKGAQAVGIPAPIARVALNQARGAQVQRLKQGGWAGLVSRATKEGGGGFRGAMRELGQNQLKALPGAISSMSPTSGFGKVLAGAGGGAAQGLAGGGRGRGAAQGALSGLMSGLGQASQGQGRGAAAAGALGGLGKMMGIGGDPDVVDMLREAGMDESSAYAAPWGTPLEPESHRETYVRGFYGW